MRQSNRSRHNISSIKELKLASGSRAIARSESKCSFIKDDMPGNNDSVRGEVKAAVSFVMSRITQEDTEGGARREFVGSCGRQVGVTFASKDAQVIIRRRCAKEGAVWRGELEGLGWQNVNQNCRCRESLGVTTGPEN